MKYVVYGAGYRGKRLLEYIGTDKIEAFIDRDIEKQGKKYCGKPVISLEEYVEHFFSCFVIISPIYSDKIEDYLEEYNIYHYTNLMYMPSEFVGYGSCKFTECYEGLICPSNKYCLYGVNILSLLIYESLHLNNKLTICPEKNCDVKKIEWIKKYHPEIEIICYSKIKNDELILLSVVRDNEEPFYNKTINLFEFANDNIRYLNEKILKLQNIHKNKKCFIIGTGPSLKLNDLYILKENNMFCFGVNSILKIHDQWVADAYVATDSYFISNNIVNIDSYDSKYKFIGDACSGYWLSEKKNSFKIHVAVAGTETIDFSEQIFQKVYAGYSGSGTVIYICMQIAVYMGFTEIYLLGVDCNYIKDSKNNHFIADETIDSMNHREDYMIKAFDYAKKYACNKGVKIYNATRGGKLEVFERVDFDNLF